MTIRPFMDRLQPAITNGGFRMDDYWLWCGSVIRGDDGKFHCFASRWPKTYPFFHGYLAASEVVRGVADNPEGPFEFAEVVLGDRGAQFWDGRMTHNPFIMKYDNEYILFYIGATYAGPRPPRAEMDALRARRSGPNGDSFPWFYSIRIGVARAPSVLGPWQRPDVPDFDIAPDSWDARMVTNPSPCVAHDGSLLLYYRSNGKLGLARAETLAAGFHRVSAQPIFDPGTGLRVEDPCIFRSGSGYEMVCKDLTGSITGEFHAAVHLHSQDGVQWQLADQVKAWSRTLLWDSGIETTQASIERPFILCDDAGTPTHLYTATADGPGHADGRPGHYFAENTWNMVRPLR